MLRLDVCPLNADHEAGQSECVHWLPATEAILRLWRLVKVEVIWQGSVQVGLDLDIQVWYWVWVVWVGLNTQEREKGIQGKRKSMNKGTRRRMFRWPIPRACLREWRSRREYKIGNRRPDLAQEAMTRLYTFLSRGKMWGQWCSDKGTQRREERRGQEAESRSG